jgi:hypothetical protein
LFFLTLDITDETAARIAKAMGMDVIAYTATPKETPEQRADHNYSLPGIGDPDGSIPSAWYNGLDKKSLHNFLSQDIDVLVVSVPLTYVSLTDLSNMVISSRRKPNHTRLLWVLLATMWLSI